MLEGIPSILLGGLMFVLLPGSIAAARFLTPEDREALAAEVARDHLDGALDYDRRTLLSLVRLVLANGYLWMLFTTGLLMSTAATTYGVFTPIIFSNLLNGTAFSSAATVAAAAGSKTLLPVALTVVPYTLAVALTYLLAASMQRHNEHFIHIFSTLMFSGVLMALFAPLAHAAVAAGFVALSVSLATSFATTGPGMVLVAQLCKGRELVVAQPMSNTFNVLGGVIGPPVTAALLKTKVGALPLSWSACSRARACRAGGGVGGWHGRLNLNPQAAAQPFGGQCMDSPDLLPVPPCRQPLTLSGRLHMGEREMFVPGKLR
jgi:ACS family tartrate transporter-like MFS transporter